MQPLPQRRHPVHKLPVERAYVPTVLFVTLAIRPRVAAFDNHSFLSVFQLAVADADAWRTVSFVLMPDHIHMFVVPNRYPPVGI
jgi:REP element-mobilizing transposase RayT